VRTLLRRGMCCVHCGGVEYVGWTFVVERFTVQYIPVL
jgi:hypothetical protein